MTLFDQVTPDDSGNVFINSNYIWNEVFMTRLIRIIVNEFLSRNRRFDLKWLEMITCDRCNSRKFQFCKSIVSKFWIFLELEMKIFKSFWECQKIINPPIAKTCRFIYIYWNTYKKYIVRSSKLIFYVIVIAFYILKLHILFLKLCRLL